MLTNQNPLLTRLQVEGREGIRGLRGVGRREGSREAGVEPAVRAAVPRCRAAPGRARPSGGQVAVRSARGRVDRTSSGCRPGTCIQLGRVCST